MVDESANSAEHVAPIARDEIPMERRIAVLDQFHRWHPPTFKGDEGPKGAEEFIDRLESIFELVGCNPAERLVISEFSLQSEAKAWWKATKEGARTYHPGNVWEVFRAAFLAKYFPFTVRKDKAREFDLLTQGRMSVDEYEAMFSSLSHYAPAMDEEKRAWKFERGLSPQIHAQLAPMLLMTLRMSIDEHKRPRGRGGLRMRQRRMNVDRGLNTTIGGHFLRVLVLTDLIPSGT